MQKFFVKNKSIVTFLILEVVALTAFNFGNVGYIFGLAGGILATIAAVFVFFITDNKRTLLPFLIPAALILIISVWGSLNTFSKLYTALPNISLAISLPGFLVLGYATRKFNDVTPKTIILIIGAALAGITLFGLLSTIFEYGFFYRLIYRDTPNYYYNGEPFDVTKEMYWLSGFCFREVYIEYGSLFAILCGSFLPALMFLSPKEERNEFIICAAIGAVGVITLLVLPNFKALLILVAASLFPVIYRFLKNNKKALKIIGISFVSCVGLAILFFIISLINAAAGYKFTGILNRIFVQNRIMIKVTPIYDALFAKVDGKLVNFFGLNTAFSSGDVAVWEESNIFEVELLKEVGLIGTALFGLFLIIMGYFTYRYLKESQDKDYIKSIFVLMVLAFFVYESLFDCVMIAPHEETYNAFLRTPILLVMLFIFGYIFTNPFKKEETVNE